MMKWHKSFRITWRFYLYTHTHTHTRCNNNKRSSSKVRRINRLMGKKKNNNNKNYTRHQANLFFTRFKNLLFLHHQSGIKAEGILYPFTERNISMPVSSRSGDGGWNDLNVNRRDPFELYEKYCTCRYLLTSMHCC